MTLTRHLDDLAAQSRWTYRAGGSSFTEPAALAAIALSAHRRRAAAMGPARWLAEMQQPNGAVGVAAGEPSPAWPTALALLAWSLVDRGARTRQFDGPVRRAAAWSLAARGKPGERSEHIGHNPTIPGWSWAADTASWLEPTCFFVLGLTAAGYRRHRRVLDGAQLIA
ncbi:MAG TPA: hypothetical protein PJ982_10705, partial [Lacipirellulaceae bacterium]|nr:hypothetical protein [Lacipirellulaceae bacterium]